MVNGNHASTENTVLHNNDFNNLSNFPALPVGIIGLVQHGYVLHKKEDEKKRCDVFQSIENE